MSNFIEFMSASGFNQVSKVRIGDAGIKFVTLISSQNAAEPLNVFFTRSSEGRFTVGQDVDTTKLNVVSVWSDKYQRELVKVTDGTGDAQKTLEARGFQTIAGLTGSATSTANLSVVRRIERVADSPEFLAAKAEMGASSDQEATYAEFEGSGKFNAIELRRLERLIPVGA